MLEPKTLSEIRRSVGILRRLKAKLHEVAAEAPRLSVIAGEIGDFGHLEKTIDRAISPEGDLLPNASDKLASIRNRLRGKRAEVVEKLQNYIQSDATRRYIQEPIVTEREGRFAIAVKAEYKGEIKGIVHDVSNSGATVFVEPFAALELGNEFKELEIEEIREIERILTELSVLVGAIAGSIEDQSGRRGPHRSGSGQGTLRPPHQSQGSSYLPAVGHRPGSYHFRHRPPSPNWRSGGAAVCRIGQGFFNHGHHRPKHRW